MTNPVCCVYNKNHHIGTHLVCPIHGAVGSQQNITSATNLAFLKKKMEKRKKRLRNKENIENKGEEYKYTREDGGKNNKNNNRTE